VGEDEGCGSEASRNGMPQVKGLKELKKLRSAAKGSPGRRGIRAVEVLHGMRPPPCPIFISTVGLFGCRFPDPGPFPCPPRTNSSSSSSGILPSGATSGAPLPGRVAAR